MTKPVRKNVNVKLLWQYYEFVRDIKVSLIAKSALRTIKKLCYNYSITGSLRNTSQGLRRRKLFKTKNYDAVTLKKHYIARPQL